MKIIQIVERVDGNREWAGQYVASYDPDYHRPDGSYDGGILEVTPHRQDAFQFRDAADAMEAWRRPVACKCHGIRPWDGKPNRPLTAFTIAVEDL